MTLSIRDFLSGKGVSDDKLADACYLAADRLIDEQSEAARSYVGRNPRTDEAMYSVSFLEAWWDRVGRNRLIG